MKELEKMPYWTPAGIVMAEPPPAYVALWNEMERGRDWDGLLAKHSYRLNGKIGEEDFSLINVIIWEHEDAHVLVAHHVARSWSIVFFIRADDVGAWSLDGFLKLVQAYAQAEQAPIPALP